MHKMTKRVAIWGSSGHARVLSEILAPQGYKVVAFFDNDRNAKSIMDGVPLFVGRLGLQDWLNTCSLSEGYAGKISGVVAIGGSRGYDRLRIQELMKDSGLTPLKVQHQSAYVSPTSSTGEGSQILAGSVISTMSEIGKASIINTNASVDHECFVGDGVHVAPGATLCGCVTLEDFTMVGAGAVVLPRIKVGSGSIIGAGSVVTKDIPSNVVVFGNPARIVREILSDKRMDDCKFLNLKPYPTIED
jgi:sugar O-acyltransferase (sialic acid O-acetyltransferase NeuD family)